MMPLMRHPTPRETMDSEQICQDRNQLLQAGGMVRLEWTLLRVFGRDAATFLHNMTTNDVRSLNIDSFCESYVLDVRGKIVAHGFIIRLADESFLFLGGPGQMATLTAHWERFVIAEDVQFECGAAQMSVWAAAGPFVDEWNNDLDDTKNGQLQAGVLFDVPVKWMPMAVFGDRTKLVVLQTVEQRSALTDNAERRGLLSLMPDTWESLRIEAGFPLYGVDITIENLPQEVCRNLQAINFNKGCYLGQETVARIDAIGHVNWHLVGLKCGKTGLTSGQELKQGTKTIAKIGSQAWIPQLDCHLALAYVRRGSESPGTQLQTDDGDLEVVGLPVTSDTHS